MKKNYIKKAVENMSIEAARTGFEETLSRHEKSIVESYRLTQTEDEIWITEQVNNILFRKR